MVDETSATSGISCATTVCPEDMRRGSRHVGGNLISQASPRSVLERVGTLRAGFGTFGPRLQPTQSRNSREERSELQIREESCHAGEPLAQRFGELPTPRMSTCCHLSAIPTRHRHLIVRNRGICECRFTYSIFLLER